MKINKGEGIIGGAKAVCWLQGTDWWTDFRIIDNPSTLLSMNNTSIQEFLKTNRGKLINLEALGYGSCVLITIFSDKREARAGKKGEWIEWEKEGEFVSIPEGLFEVCGHK